MKCRGGFTLVELLAVICILALIASLGTPAIQKAAPKATVTTSSRTGANARITAG